MALTNKKILLGITGGIAAYKTCELIRLLQKKGAEVKVVMTDNAKEFVSSLTLSVLSKNKVYCEQFNYTDYDVEHVALTNWADLFLIAPMTANTISKVANGICDNLLTSTICAFNKKIILAPAMNVEMWENKTIQENLNKLKKLNFSIIEPEEGYLACGINAKGRMADLENILKFVEEYFLSQKKNKKILITTGGTKENIDPVRYVGNYSSGKMGIALADEAYALGYDVTLISTVNAKKPYPIIMVKSAENMFDAVKNEFATTDYLIMAAAVADFKPINISEQKIKKEGKETFVIEMVKNPDILKEMGKIKKDNQKIIGFCAESENLIANATKKIKEKNIDFIVANDISRSDIGFGSDYNEVVIIAKNGERINVSKQSKNNIAKEILSFCISY